MNWPFIGEKGDRQSVMETASHGSTWPHPQLFGLWRAHRLSRRQNGSIVLDLRAERPKRRMSPVRPTRVSGGSVLRHLVGVDGGDHVGVIRVIVLNVVLHLREVKELELAVRALVHG